MKIKRPTYTEFICTRCKCHEKIPTNIVLQMDIMDPGDPSYPPMFDCEKCGGLMKPVYFVGYSGVKVNIKLIKKYKIELIKKFNIVFPENAII